LHEWQRIKGSIVQAVQTALVQRADLKQSNQEKRAAKYSIQIAKSGYLPSVILSFKKEWQKQENSADQWSAQMAVAFNIFDGGKTEAKIKQAKWDTAKANELLQQISAGYSNHYGRW
jgi:outer membrane protein TolC